MARVLAAPEAPTEPGTETVAVTELPGAIVPRLCGRGVAVAVPTLTLVIETPVAAVPPLLETVN